MNEQITFDLINKFSKLYNDDKTNKIIENAITKNGLEKSCIDRGIIEENQPIFNIELPNSKRYDQKNNFRCWIYSGLNTIKYNIIENLNIDLNDFVLSNNYIAFYDKFEKSNNTYENIINLENTDWKYINEECILEDCVTECGNWKWFISILNKYGLVPYENMPDAVESLEVDNITRLFTNKVKKDCTKLLEGKINKCSKQNLRKMKEEFLKENYMFLSKVLGEPQTKFNYEYVDKNSDFIKLENITPLEFKDKFLTIDLNDFVFIANLPMYNKEFYKIYKAKYLGNIYKDSYAEVLNLPINEIKELSIKQLKDNIPVYIGINIRNFRDKKSGILDTRLYNYNKTFGFDLLSKEEALNTREIFTHHCMAICGVYLGENNKPQRWKVEDSYGTEEKVDGFYIMNDNYFDKFIFHAIIHKKYLSDKQLEVLKQEPIEFEARDPF